MVNVKQNEFKCRQMFTNFVQITNLPTPNWKIECKIPQRKYIHLLPILNCRTIDLWINNLERRFLVNRFQSRIKKKNQKRAGEILCNFFSLCLCFYYQCRIITNWPITPYCNASHSLLNNKCVNFVNFI